MLDDLNPRDQMNEESRVSPRIDVEVGKRSPSIDRRPMADREVPITVSGASEMEMMHAWLDGDLSESELTGEAAQMAAFWNRLDRDLEMHRQVTAPMGFADRVMADLATMAAPMIDTTPWYTKTLTMNTIAFAAAAAGLLAIGAAIGASMHLR